MAETDIEQILRDAQPSWTKDGKGVRGDPLSGPASIPQKAFTDTNSIRHIIPGPLEQTSTTTQDVTQQTQTVAADNAHYSFEMENATDSEGYKVLIHDGQVNGVTPPGMGNDDFILTVGALGSAGQYVVWLEGTYDTMALTFTSLSLSSGNTIPDSTLGDAFFLIGFATVEDNGHGGFTFSIQNTQCGDINVAFMYGALNGAPGLYLLAQVDDPQPLT